MQMILTIVNTVKNKLLFFYIGVIVLIFSFSMIYVFNHAAPSIDIRNTISLHDMHFISLNEDLDVDIVIEGNRLKVAWNDIDDTVYITSFDGDVSRMPSESYHDLSYIPQGTKNILAEINMSGTFNDVDIPYYQCHAYLITYNEHGQVDAINQRIIFDNVSRARTRTIKSKVSADAMYYKVLFRIYPEVECVSGEISINSIDIVFV